MISIRLEACHVICGSGLSNCDSGTCDSISVHLWHIYSIANMLCISYCEDENYLHDSLYNNASVLLLQCATLSVDS